MNDVVLFEDNPIFAKNFAAADIANIIKEIAPEGITQFDIDRIKVPSSGATMWQLETLEGDVSEKELMGIPLAIKTVRAYWSVAYDESGGGVPPECNSQDGMFGIGEPGGDCIGCPLAKYESASKGRGQACKQMRLVFILRPDSMLPSVLIVPPTSLKDSKQFFLRLAAKGVDYKTIMIAVGLEKDKNSDGLAYSKMRFSMAKKLSTEHSKKVAEYAQQMAPLFGQVTIDQGMTD